MIQSLEERKLIFAEMFFKLPKIQYAKCKFLPSNPKTFFIDTYK